MQKIKKIKLCIVCLTCFFACSNEKQTDCILDRKVVDMKYIKLGNSDTAIFCLKNIGNNPLLISNIIPDCYCTIPKFDKSTVNQNDSLKIQIIIKKENLGIFQQTVKFNCNTKQKFYLLAVRGKIIP